MVDALCRGARAELFFPDQPTFWRALEVCQECDVQPECLSWALDRPEVFGVWGGTTPQERAQMRIRNWSGSKQSSSPPS